MKYNQEENLDAAQRNQGFLISIFQVISTNPTPKGIKKWLIIEGTSLLEELFSLL